jgi:hypothetical protein
VAQTSSQRLRMGPPRHTVYVKSTPVPIPAYVTPVPTEASVSESQILRDALPSLRGT